jgi:hypothetical protein
MLNFTSPTELSHSPTSYFTSLHSTGLKLDNGTENTTSNQPSIVVIGGCLAIGWASFLREGVYQSLRSSACFFSRMLHNSLTTWYTFNKKSRISICSKSKTWNLLLLEHEIWKMLWSKIYLSNLIIFFFIFFVATCSMAAFEFLIA